MSVVTSAVIVVAYAPQEVVALLTEPQFFGRLPEYKQGFAKIDTTHAGGGKALQSDVYAAGLNHIVPDELVDWFLALPWGPAGEAVLAYDVESDQLTVVCVPERS